MRQLKQLHLWWSYKKAWIRAIILSRLFSGCGEGVEIFEHCRFYNYSNITLGNFVLINYGCEFEAIGGPIKIGHYVLFGPGCKIITLKRRYTDHTVPIYFQPHEKKQHVTIEDDVWIGANAIILPNITVGRGAIVAAGAIVSKDVKPFSIVGGVPARPIGDRFDGEKQKAAHDIDFASYRAKRIKY